MSTSIFRSLPIALTLTLAAAASPVNAAYQRDTSDYRVDVLPIPLNGADALATLDGRKLAVVSAAGCQDDLQFWASTWSDKPRDRGENANFVMIGKMGVLLRNKAAFRTSPDTIVCDAVNEISVADIRLPSSQELTVRVLGAIGGMTDDLEMNAINDSIVAVSGRVDGDVRNRFTQTFGSECDNTIQLVEFKPFLRKDLNDARTAKLDDRGKFLKIRITYKQSLRCFKKQVNVALLAKEVLGRPGSSDLPCVLEGDPAGAGVADPGLSSFQVTGEWDVDMRDLIRILYLHGRSGDPQFDMSNWILDPPTTKHIREDLIILDTPPGIEHYSPLQCGNQENVTGDAAERLSERKWAKKALDSLGDLLKWLFHRAVLIGLIVAGAAILLTYFPAYFTAVVVAGAAAAVAGGIGRIPETENHLLMMETTRYLHNQLILDDLARDFPDDDRGPIEDDQAEVREWVMERLREIYKNDFDEYNARPYQRYSLLAIMNLAEFARDDKVSTAAKLVLTTTAVKVALATNDSVRWVPFRRRRSVLSDQYFCHQEGDHLKCNSNADLSSGADHWVGLMQLFAGQTRQTSGKITVSAAKELTYAATSSYAPPTPVLALAVTNVQSSPRWQIRRHTVPEVTYSERAFVVTAGSVTSGPANYYELSVAGVAIPIKGARVDRGTGVPTTLQFRPRSGLPVSPTDAHTPTPDQTILANVIRIFGKPDFDKNHAWTDTGMPLGAAESQPALDNNLCIYRGFACGVNIVVPLDYESCLVTDPLIPGLWFLDTGSCPAIKNMERTYVALWRKPCSEDAADEGCRVRMGFFEVISATEKTAAGVRDLPFFEFTQRVRTRNSAKHAIGFGCRDTYVTARGALQGQSINYRCDDPYGIRSVDGTAIKDYTAEARAKGNILTRSGNGYVHSITLPEASATIVLDWSNENNPIHP